MRREKSAILVFGLGFTLLVAAAVIFIDPSFFYSRLETDALLYYLKGKTFAETGSTAARLAINLAPFPYASMPGVLRAPLIGAFADFNDQLRAIQLSNIVILDAIALMSAYMFSWVLPAGRHWIAIGFAFGFTLLSPWWMANIFITLADAPYAACSLASMLIAIRTLASPRPLATRPVALAAFVIFFALGFSFRFTEPVVLVLAAVLAKERFAGRNISVRVTVGAAIVLLALVSLLVFINRDAILGRYLAEPMSFIVRGEKREIIISLFSLAIPAQIVPGFSLGFSHAPMIDLYHAEFARTPRDIAWSVAGVAMSLVVVKGAWNTRSRLLPELLLLLAVMPLLAVVMPSTPRYLMTYQPFFWIWFYEGARLLMRPVPLGLRRLVVSGSAVFAVLALAISLVVGIRSRQSARGAPERATKLTAIMSEYIAGMTDTYRPLKRYLMTLPRKRAILSVGARSGGRWKAIANLDYYAFDSGLVDIARRRDVYTVIECDSVDQCSNIDRMEAVMKDRFCTFGEFSFQLVFEAHGARSRARVYRVRPA